MITAGQIRAARGLLNINQSDLAEKAGLNTATILRIEKDEKALETAETATIRKIKNALEASGIKFLPPKEEDGISGIGVRYFVVDDKNKQN